MVIKEYWMLPYHSQSSVSKPDTMIQDVYPIGTMIMNLHDRTTGLIIDWEKDYTYVNILVNGKLCNILATELTYWRIYNPSANVSRD